MKADTINVIELFDNGKVKYFIPTYQRPYSWKGGNVETLFRDMMDLITKKNDHFIGTIVTINQENSGQIKTLQVIDGQQRITTLCLFVIAYMNSKNFEKNNRDELNDTYLINRYLKDKKDQYKLHLINKDRKIYEKLIKYEAINLKNKLHENEKKSNLYKNYLILLNLINEQNISFEDFNCIMHHLTVVTIALNSSDNPQLIFESINSTGLDLSQADLIKNFVLMNHSPEEQAKLYEDYWKEMEDYLISINKLETFFKTYLTIKLETSINENKVYFEFKKFVLNNKLNGEEFIKDIYQNFILLKKMLNNNTEKSKIDRELKLLNMLPINVWYPIGLKALIKNEEGVFLEDDVTRIINILSSYIVRRGFCDLPTGALVKMFISLLNCFNNEDYMDQFVFKLLSQFKTQRFPKDENFKEAFVYRDFYSMKMARNILTILERYQNKNNMDLSNHTLEHVLPQGNNVPEVWKQELGNEWESIKDKYVHTIGNITFTAYNSELSNNSFRDKLNCKGGFKETNIKLNKYINDQTEWKKRQIVERAQELFNLAIQIWPEIKLEEEKFKKYESIKNPINNYTLDNYKMNSIAKSIYDFLLEKLDVFFPNNVQEYNKLHINIIYESETIINIIPRKNSIDISFDCDEKEMILSKYNFIIDKSNIGHWGNKNLFVKLEKVDKLFIEELLTILKKIILI